MAGEFSAMLADQTARISSALRRAVDSAGAAVQADLRAQAHGAGFSDGGRAVARAWRRKTYPAAGAVTFNPAAVIRSRMPEAVDAFERGATITTRGRRYLVWPTGYNAPRGRVKAGSKGGVRVTPAQMMALPKGERFVLHSKKNPAVSLWCLRVRQATGLKAGRGGRGRLRLFVGGDTEIGTGKVKGAALKRRDLARAGFVPMFFMMRRAHLRKRLDVQGARERGLALLQANIVAELNRI